MGRRVAWWLKGQKLLEYRGWLLFHGFDWDVELNDRLVQGESMEELVKVVEGWIKKKKEYLGRPDTFMRRDRYGNEWPMQEAINVYWRVIEAMEQRLSAMESGEWVGPTHTISLTEDDRWDHTSVEIFHYTPSEEQ